MSLTVEDILLSRRSATVNGCTEEVWRKRQEEEKKRKAEVVADKISELMVSSEAKVNQLVDRLKEARQIEKQIKNQLDAIGLPFLYAKSGLSGDSINISKVAPLIVEMGEELEDFGMEDVSTVVPADFVHVK